MTSRDEKRGSREPWLDDPDAPPSAEELAEAAKLRDELGRGEESFAGALRSAHSPRELDQLTHERILRRAVLPPATRRAPRIVVLAIGASGFLAAAAAAVLFFGSMKRSAYAPAAVQNAPLALVPCRSTQELFDEPFPLEGGESNRVDRIASSRGRDLRANRFASWGVR